jgi:transposase
MATRMLSPENLGPGVRENPHGGYHLHVVLDDGGSPVLSGATNQDRLAPPDAPVLAGMSVFEDVVVLDLQGGQSLMLHVTDPAAWRSVLFFYHANGTLWRAVPLEPLNPGWVLGQYRFRGDLGKFDVRLARMRQRFAPPKNRSSPTLWWTGGWQSAVVYTAQSVVERVWAWQHTSDLTQPRVVTPNPGQVEAFQDVPPADVQVLATLQEQGVEKVTYQIGGLNLVLAYVERIGLAEAVDRRCHRDGDVSEGTVITVLVVNRLLAPCALRKVAKWVEDTGLHLLLGTSDPGLLNYDRLADALLAVYPYWQEIAAEVTLKAVEQFQLAVETIHYDLTSVFFHGTYEGSSWVEFGYSRDHRPDKPQVNIGLTTTADGEVVLPGGSNVHPGSVNDATTTVATHTQLHNLFQRSDLLVTGDRIMQGADNMLAIACAGGRFLGPVKWTPYIHQVVARCQDKHFQFLPGSSKKYGHPIKAAFCHLRFKVKKELSNEERQRIKTRRKRQRKRGPTPKYRETHFRVRATIILDTTRQAADAARRKRRLQAYEAQLKWVCDHLNKGQYYGDPEWVAGYLADLAHDFKDVRTFVQVTFKTHQDEEKMSLTYRRRPDRMAQAARVDGKWVLVSNQPLAAGQSCIDYMDWMLCVYRNHRHVERRMRNLKSDLPIRPIYLHRDDAIVTLCFVSVVALMVYTLIERDCQANPALMQAGLRTTDQVLETLSSFCLTAFFISSGQEFFWFDTPTEAQKLIWRELGLPDPGTRVPSERPACLTACEEKRSRQSVSLATQKLSVQLTFLAAMRLSLWDQVTIGIQTRPSMQLSRYSLLCYAENKRKQILPLGSVPLGALFKTYT